MNIVLFLGAGFSAPFGMPTMNQFVDKARTSNRLTNEKKELIFELFKKNRDANFILDSPRDNLENILSYSLMGERLDLLNEGANPLSQIVKDIIRSIYTEIKDFDNYRKMCDQFKIFLGFDLVKTSHRLEIITTNYDLNIESALYCNDSKAELPFEYEDCNFALPFVHSKIDNLYDTAKKRVRLYKLHGSVNWFELRNDSKMAIDGRIIHTSDISSTKGDDIKNVVGRPIPVPIHPQYEYEGEPVIVPPSFIKPQFRSELNRIWSAAAGAIQNADILIFVGYSFAQSDTEMKYFLGRSLADNIHLSEIKIVDINANHIVQRLNEKDSGYGQHFKGYLQPFSSDWTHVTLGMLGIK